jgi:hypothetical protein
LHSYIVTSLAQLYCYKSCTAILLQVLHSYIVTSLAPPYCYNPCTTLKPTHDHLLSEFSTGPSILHTAEARRTLNRQFPHKSKEERRKCLDIVVAFRHISLVLIRLLSKNPQKGLALNKTETLSGPLFWFLRPNPPAFNICQR